MLGLNASPQNSYVKIIPPKGMSLGGALGGDCLWEVIRSWGQNAHEWMGALIKGTPERSLVPSVMWGYSEKTASQWGSGLLRDNESASAIILDFPVASTGRNAFLLVLSPPQFMVFCYSCLNWLRQATSFKKPLWNPLHYDRCSFLIYLFSENFGIN